MANARIGNRIGRLGRRNPGRHHLAGGDVTAHMDRQYEAILDSLRRRHRFGSDERRKSVAAATARKLAQNPGVFGRLWGNLAGDDETLARQLTEDFHGRPVRDLIEVEQTEHYDEYGAVLGYLEELGVLTEDEQFTIPISFKYGRNDSETVFVVSNPAGTNIEFVGGDQDIDWEKVEGASAQDKYLVSVGPVLTIAYWADKHHLSGPKSQANGISYEHEFGDEGGELPFLVFDRQNKRLLLVGGDYTITPEGIAG